MKKFVSLLVALVMLFSLSATAFAGSSIYVMLDGNYIGFDVKPQVISGRTMVPIRAIFEKMGATVSWDGNSNSAICTKGSTVVKMTVGNMIMYVNNQPVKMDIAPLVINGRTLAPARYAAEAFGAKVDWDENTKTVIIRTTVTMYAIDGRTISVPKNEVEAYKKVGWYATKAETQQTLYAADGRTIVVYKAEVPAYKKVGWYETKAQAEASKPVVNKPVSQPTNSNNPGPDGNYYRTPTGTKYHLDPNCGGKNSRITTNISGLEPCKKCAQ